MFQANIDGGSGEGEVITKTENLEITEKKEEEGSWKRWVQFDKYGNMK